MNRGGGCARALNGPLLNGPAVGEEGAVHLPPPSSTSTSPHSTPPTSPSTSSHHGEDGLRAQPGAPHVHAVADVRLLRGGGGGEPADQLAGHALRLLPHAVGRDRAGGGPDRRALLRQDPVDGQEHVRLDPGRGDGRAGQRRLPHGALLHHRAGGHRALQRAAGDPERGGGDRGGGGRAAGQPAGALHVPRQRSRGRRRRRRAGGGPRTLAHPRRRLRQPPLAPQEEAKRRREAGGQRQQRPRPGGDQHPGEQWQPHQLCERRQAGRVQHPQKRRLPPCERSTEGK